MQKIYWSCIAFGGLSVLIFFLWDVKPALVQIQNLHYQITKAKRKLSHPALPKEKHVVANKKIHPIAISAMLVSLVNQSGLILSSLKQVHNRTEIQTYELKLEGSDKDLFLFLHLLERLRLPFAIETMQLIDAKVLQIQLSLHIMPYVISAKRLLPTASIYHPLFCFFKKHNFKQAKKLSARDYHWVGRQDQNGKSKAWLQAPNGVLRLVQLGSVIGHDRAKIIKLQDNQIIAQMADSSTFSYTLNEH